jgi:hypothetical protein
MCVLIVEPASQLALSPRFFEESAVPPEWQQSIKINANFFKRTDRKNVSYKRIRAFFLSDTTGDWGSSKCQTHAAHIEAGILKHLRAASGR